MTAVDQWARWRHAITTGTRVSWERGDVASGYYKRDTGRGAAKAIEAICIYRDDAGTLQCIRDVYGDGSRMDADQIEELFASCCAYPVSEEIYRSVEDGQPWPPEYGTRLTMKEIEAGVAWTPELGRKKLGGASPSTAAPITDTAAENPRAVIGDNRPPEETPAGHKLEGDQTPDKLAFAEVSELAAGVKSYLDGIGGKPRDKDEADTLADFSTKFAALHDKHDEARKAEKKPHLDASREVDAKWKRPITNAETGKTRCKAIAQEWRDAENARRDEEARKANERAAADAKQAGTAAPEPIRAERVGGIGNLRAVAERTNKTWSVVDPKAYLAHLLTLDGDLPAEIVEAAGKVAQRRAEGAPGVECKVERKAA